jgi:hypothetical protein
VLEGMEKIKWIDHLRNEAVLQRVKRDRNILLKIKNKKKEVI